MRDKMERCPMYFESRFSKIGNDGTKMNKTNTCLPAVLFHVDLSCMLFSFDFAKGGFWKVHKKKLGPRWLRFRRISCSGDLCWQISHLQLHSIHGISISILLDMLSHTVAVIIPFVFLNGNKIIENQGRSSPMSYHQTRLEISKGPNSTQIMSYEHRITGSNYDGTWKKKIYIYI